MLPREDNGLQDVYLLSILIPLAADESRLSKPRSVLLCESVFCLLSKESNMSGGKAVKI
jgi:hypothetical protein